MGWLRGASLKHERALLARTTSLHPGRVDSALHPSEVDKMSSTRRMCGGLLRKALKHLHEPSERLWLESGSRCVCVQILGLARLKVPSL